MRTPLFFLPLLWSAACAEAPRQLDPQGDIGIQAEDMLAALPGAERLGEARSTRVQHDALGMTHVTVQQLFEGLPVAGGAAIVHYHPDGAVRAITDQRLRDPQQTRHRPAFPLPAEEAPPAVWERALAHYLLPDAGPVAVQQALRLAAEDLDALTAAAEGDDSGLDTGQAPARVADPCEESDAPVIGAVVGDEDFALQPDGAPYRADTAGLHRACVVGPAEAELMLVALSWRGLGWRVVDYAVSEAGVAALSISGASGTEYTWLVVARDAGEGYTYRFGLDRP